MSRLPNPGFWRNRKVLVTGHTGFKGAWCAFWLQQMGAEVTGLSLPPEPGANLWAGLGEPGGASFGDIRDPEAVARSMNGSAPEIVLHLAAQALVQTSYASPADTFATNVMGLVHVLEAARSATDLRAVVNVTSDKCYENSGSIWAYREIDPMGGADPYSASKGCAELVTASYRRSFFDCEDSPLLASGRAGNVIGGGDWSTNRLIPDCVRAFTDGKAVVIRNPLATRPWQHVLEPVAGYLLLAESLVERGRDFAQGWNFGPSDADLWPVGRVVTSFAERWGSGAHWAKDETQWAHEALLLRVDATKARLALGWSPLLDVPSSLAWTVDWYQHVLNGGSVAEMTARQISDYMALAD